MQANHQLRKWLMVGCIHSKENVLMKSISFYQGHYAEQQFVRVASAYDWDVAPASEKENMSEHIDFYVSKRKARYAIDVKGMKATTRRNAIVQDEWHVVEFIAVVYPRSSNGVYTPTFNPLEPDFSHGSGRPGWVYGNADMIAFETKHLWVFVRPSELIALCASTIDFSLVASSSEEAKYAIYSRPNRGDLFTYVHINDIHAIRCGVWKKSVIL